MRRLLTLTIALLVSTTAFAGEDVIRKGFNVGAGGTLRLDAGVGDIKIVTGGTGVAFEVTREGTAKKLGQHKIEFRQSGNDVIVESDLEDNNWGWFGHDRYEVQWNIRVPASYNIAVRTSGGSIDLADMGGTVDAHTSGGSIETGRLAGPA